MPTKRPWPTAFESILFPVAAVAAVLADLVVVFYWASATISFDPSPMAPTEDQIADYRTAAWVAVGLSLGCAVWSVARRRRFGLTPVLIALAGCAAFFFAVPSGPLSQHRPPADHTPPPSRSYSPCYSGSGRCN